MLKNAFATGAATVARRRAEQCAGLFAAFAVALASAAASAQCLDAWHTGPHQGIAGLNGEARAMVEWDPDGDGSAAPLLVVGGEFTIAGQAFASNVAAWSPGDAAGTGEPAGWHPLGAGLDGRVLALTVFNGQLIAGGAFTFTGDGLLANNLARYDGVSWYPIESGVSGRVEALIEHNGQLIIGGGFQGVGSEPQAVAAWSGIEGVPILPLAADQPNSVVYDLAVYNGDLIIGGVFNAVGSVPAFRVARFDGASWHALGSGVNSGVHALTIYDGALVAAGNFSFAGGQPASRIARWDGQAWSAFGDGFVRGEVDALTVYDGRLIAGVGTPFGADDDRKLAAWNENSGGTGTWESLGVIPTWGVHALGEYAGQLVVAGSLYVINDDPIAYVGRYDEAESRWRAFGPGATSTIETFFEFGGRLIAGGAFTTIGDIEADRIAAYDPYSGWSAIGAGLQGGGVRAIAEYDGHLIAAGDFTHSAGVAVHGIAGYDGAAWQPLGAGFDGAVRALAVYQGELVAGGDFTMAGGAPAGCIAAWNGSSWRALGPGMVSINQPLGPAVYALAVYKGVLYAAGAFSHVDPWTVNSIARWDGVSWRRVTSGVTGPIGNYIFALHEHDGDLYVGGTFDIAGGFQSRSIARWDGQEWWPVGMGSSSVFTLGTHDGDLYAGGSFSYSFGPDVVNLRRIARYDAVEGWSEVGGGLDIRVSALRSYHDELFIAGSFRTAGSQVSSFYARWGPADSTLCRADLNCDAAVDVFDLLTYLEDWFGHAPAAERTEDVPAAIDVFDLLSYLEEWFGGC